MLETDTNNNPIETPNTFNKKYQLHFDGETAEKIKVFCETFYIESNHFIVKAVRWHLRNVEDDIDNQEYNIFTRYFDLSKLIGKCSEEISLKEQERKNVVEAEFHPLISDAIEILCEKVHWTPKEFIEHQVKWEINDIISKIKGGDYSFLDKYFDFSEIKESISQIYKNKLL